MLSHGHDETGGSTTRSEKREPGAKGNPAGKAYNQGLVLRHVDEQSRTCMSWMEQPPAVEVGDETAERWPRAGWSRSNRSNRGEDSAEGE